MAESRKLRRVYPYHISLAYPFRYNPDKGEVFECLVGTYLGLKYYWREGKNEIDFLVKEQNEISPIEVKSSGVIKSKMTDSLKFFLKEYKTKRNVLIYAGKKGHHRKTNGELIEIEPIIKVLWDLKI